ncbi:hypothetical protein ACFHWD_07390 [Clostridium sp. MT-14]|jgi:Ni/Fe-hydrogenase subunit HybB-like protein|uniref:Uncharacterized protein n=1 Tax=Clostridium aromativorans TaxID=2836848 RepID=A0ABS8N7A8_9CLOT|nr:MULTISPECIES: hypothetical protein [Clostridium]KAA8677083.1 hypothetical protein F3O63_02900 [Clostridium sp. HV4-5-A1G]MCC9294633.1 hypothetical protein [Clostridium aromativorans]CAB1243754.1 conserved hypothetical protein [Clostridiaceae bacterium BL-3]
MYFLLVILGLIVGIVLILTGIGRKNSDMISIGSVLSIFFLLICINVYMPNFISELKTISIDVHR